MHGIFLYMQKSHEVMINATKIPQHQPTLIMQVVQKIRAQVFNNTFAYS